MKLHLKNIERKFDYIDKSQYDYILNQSERSDKFSNILFEVFKQNLTQENLINALDRFKESKLLIIGDTIVDQYSACEPLGMSAEAPINTAKVSAIKDAISRGDYPIDLDKVADALLQAYKDIK